MTILPTNRLLLTTALIFFPGTLVPVFLPETETTAAVLMAGLFFASVLDALGSRSKLKGIDLTVPGVVRLSRGRASVIPVSMTHGFTKPQVLRLGLVLPKGVDAGPPDGPPECRLVLSKNTGAGQTDFPVISNRTGCHALTDLRLEIRSTGGFWSVREKRTVRSEIRVYPDLAAERRALASLFLERGTGSHARRMVGKGREFEKLREYAPGDTYEDIHWKATARRARPISKVFQVERTQDIYVFVDASRLSGRPATLSTRMETGERRAATGERAPVESVFDRYLSAALTTGLAAEKQGDRFGMGVFADSVLGFVKARSGKTHFNICRDLVYTVAPRRVSPDYSEFFTFTGTRLRKRSLIFILTSLEDPVTADHFLANIHVLSRKHLVMVVMLKPPSVAPIFHSKGAEVNTAADIHRHLAGHTVWTGLHELETALNRQGVGFFLTDNPSLCPFLVSRYLDVKQRQTL